MFILLRKKTLKYIILVVTILFTLSISTVFLFSVSSNVFEEMQTKDGSNKGIAVPIIMYHSLMKESPEMGKYVIKPTEFENDLKYLREHDYDSISMTDLINYVHNDSDLPAKPVIITFDDGNMNNYFYATPILDRYQMKAVISVIGILSKRDSEAEKIYPDYSYLTWDQIKNMSDSGLYEIQNHTYNLHSTKNRLGIKRKSGETMEDYRKVLISDISELQNILTSITGITPNTFTYPFGSVSKDSVPILKEIGFKATLSCVEGVNYIDKNKADILFGLKRMNRPHGISSEAFFKNFCP